MENQLFYVSGMTCDGCESAVGYAVSKLDGVCSVRVSHQQGRMEVSYSLPCTQEQIEHAVRKAGYEVSDSPKHNYDVLYFLVILMGLYVIAKQFGWTGIFRVFPTVSGEQVGYAALFLVGLLTSVHCVSMCGGLNLSQSMKGETCNPIRGSILYNLGRLSGYTLIGGILGLIGEKAAVSLQLRGVIGLVAGCFMLLMGINMMGGISLHLHIKLPKILTHGVSVFKKHGSYAVGIVNGLMPCGPLQSMQLYAVASGGFWAGAASMFFFCLGTIPLVLICGITAGVLKMNWRKRMMQLGTAMLILMGIFTIHNNLALAGVVFPWSKSVHVPIIATVEGDVQYITTNLRADGYDDIQVVEGIPVVWTIFADSQSLNGCNNQLVLHAFDCQVKLKEGSTTISFVPEKAGSYTYTCWMGMLKNTITVVER